MSKYFTYRSLDDLRADIAERGIDIDLADDVDPLLQPSHGRWPHRSATGSRCTQWRAATARWTAAPAS